MSRGQRLQSFVLVVGLAHIFACGYGDGADSHGSALALTRTSDGAWAELQRLHAASVDAHLASLSSAERSAVEREFARRAQNPRELRAALTSAGTPRAIVGPGFRVTASDLGVRRSASVRDLAEAFVRHFAPVWRVSSDVFRDATVSVEEHRGTVARDVTTVEYRQRFSGLRVAGGVVTVVIDPVEAVVVAATGSFLPIDGLATSPTLTAADAVSASPLDTGEEAANTRLVVWSAYRSGGDATPHLAWEVRVGTPDGGLLRSEFVDAVDGSVLGATPIARDYLKRSLWDLRAVGGYDSETCQRWQMLPPCSSYPDELVGCPAQCAACTSDVTACALCTCRDPGATGGCSRPADPLACETTIWRYDETTGCVANGDPVGEGNCDPEALQLWGDLGTAYTYWQSAFARDSWDNLGTWMWGKVNANTTRYAGRTQPKYVDDDGTFDLVQVTIRNTVTAPQLDGHEIGHALQFGTETYTITPSFHAQGIDVTESNADTHAFRYRGLSLGQGLPPGSGYRCDASDGSTTLDHYTGFRTLGASQSNKVIGDCHDWLLSNDTGSPITHHGITVAPVTQATYDQIWFRALDVYFSTDDTYFDWWNEMVQAAYDVCGGGYCSYYFSTVDARDAVGGFTPLASMPLGVTSPQNKDRIAAVGWAGASRGPCVFYRYSGSTQAIFWSCYTPSGWTSAALLNDVAVDPADSEPAATFRYESGKNYIYVFWKGTDERVRYRRFDVDTFAVGVPQYLVAGGSAVYTCNAPAVAPIYETASIDRLVVAYHPRAYGTTSCDTGPNPLSWLFWTYLGSAAAPVDLGWTFDTPAPPSLVGYPYYDRVYLFRPDLATTATPYQIKYGSYTLAGGWTGLTNLTAVYNTDSFMPTNAVRTDRGVSLAEYNRTYIPTYPHSRLRMTFVTMGDGTGGQQELWYARLRQSESTPGLLLTEGARAVPLASVITGGMQSSGGLAVGVQGYPMSNFWGSPGPNAPKMYEWHIYGD